MLSIFHRDGQARECVAQGLDIGKAAHIESEARFTLHAGACSPYSEPFHSKARLAVSEHKCFTHLDREIWLAWHLRLGDGQEGDLRLNGIVGLAGYRKGLRRPRTASEWLVKIMTRKSR
jgi:hypothetical protein